MYSMLDQNYITALVITYRGEISLYDRAEISIFNMAEMSMYDRAEMSMYDRPIVMARTTTACCPVCPRCTATVRFPHQVYKGHATRLYEYIVKV